MEEAKRKRTAARGWLTRVETQLIDTINNPDASLIKILDSVQEFENRLHNLDESQALIETVIDIEELEPDIEMAAEFRSQKRLSWLKA